VRRLDSNIGAHRGTAESLPGLLQPPTTIRVTADLYSLLQKQTAAKAARHMDAALGVSNAQGVS
jgi:hypothetical protein